jgi:hypothetical protein
MGTSHEAPMMRGIEEWNRHDDNGTDPYGGNGQWSFRMNRDAVTEYFRDGAERMKEQNIEGVVTLGMRGPGDVGLPDGDAIPLMEDIIATQRQILAEEFDQPLEQIPQVFTLYKEVQRYWDRGMRPPDDVTIVFADDNWGNMRKLPDQKVPKRAGGYGLYYHYDYVGGGRNYKWVDTVNLANAWEQLSTSYKYGVDRLWMFNVGDMKNEELPLQFSMDMAWNPNAMTLDKLDDWEEKYAAQNFGTARADDIAEVLHEYGQLQARRKPELLNRKISLDPAKDPATDSSAVLYDDQGNPYSLTNYSEHARVTAEWARLSARAEQIGRSLPDAYQDAYYQLVLYHVKATANLYAFRLAEFTNLMYADQGRAATNDLATETERLFGIDLELAEFYNTELADGKWRNWQLQPHIDYGDVARYGPNAPWQQPELNDVAIPDVIFPAIKRIDVPAAADMGVAIDGSDKWWPNEQGEAVLPAFSPYQAQPGQYIEVFNRGQADFDFQIESGAPYVKVTPSSGRVDKQVRANVRVDWARAPQGTTNVPLTVTGPDGDSVEVKAVVHKPAQPPRSGFVEANGYVSMEAGHFSRAVAGNGVSWQRIPDIGRTGDGMTPLPVTADSQTPGGASPRLEYEMNLTTTGPVKVTAFLSPRNFVLPTTMTPSDGLKYAVSIDDGPPQIVNVTTATGANDTSMNKQWERNTSDNTNRTTTTHTITQPGVHTLKFWMVDPTVILQNIVVNTGGAADSYLGPPESLRLGR